MSDAENNNKGIAKIRELISSFEYEKISCKELIFICNCCSLFKAKFNESEHIFILEFNFFEQSILEDEANYYNYNENIFSLIYNNDNNDLSLFVDNSLIAYNTDNTLNSLIKLQLFYNVLSIIKKIHRERISKSN